MKTKRILSLVLALCTILSVLCGFSFTASAAEIEYVEVAANTELAETSANYGLAKNIQDGNILHCFDWKYNDIKAELKSIAEAGFTSVQTSPAQPAGGGEWYWLYQPLGFYIGNNPLGSKGDLQSLCQEADKYGIKVVVDVVANHLNGEGTNVQDDLRDGQYWHNYGDVSSWADRYQVTQGRIGMRDLNSEHPYVQQVVAKYIDELASVGVDGIRWDAAKHIGLPSENCQFWPAVTKGNSLWHYGEILVGPADGGGTEGLMKEYTNYMSVTDSVYGADVRNAFAGGNVPGSNGNWVNRGIAPNKLVLWAESHDTYSNGPDDWGASTNIDQNKIDRAYAVVASRNGSNALYFSRPGARDKGAIKSGMKGSTSFKATEVAAVNQLKNACGNEKDYFQSSNGCAVVSRESGAVIVLGGGGGRDVSVANGGGITKPGTYKDLVSGSTWTVTSSQMTGRVGDKGIAVLLNATPRVEGPSAYATPGSTNYTTDTYTVTLNFENATSGQYSINGGAFQSFTNGQKITIGKGTAAGTKTTISVKASNGKETSEAVTYEYNLSVSAEPGIYYDNSSTGWGSVKCYVYKNGQGAAEWPGLTMESKGNNIWYLKPPAGFEDCQVIFSDNGNNQYPAEDGLQYSSNQAMICIGTEWKEHTVIDDSPVVKPTQPQTQPVQTQPTTQAPQPTVAPPQPTTQAPQPTQPQPTQPKPTVPTPTVPKTEPTEDDIIVIPPAPTATTPVQKPTIPNTNAGEKHKYGDLDANGKVTIKDATLMQKALAKLATLNTLQLIVSDVTGDGKINVKDATTIQKFCAFLIKNFESGEWYTVPGSVVEPTQPKPTQAPQTEPTEKPVVTQPIVTQPVQTQPVVTQPIVTQPVQTQPPVTEPPVTEPPVTEPPVTEPPVTEPQEPDNYIYLKSTWSSVNCHSWPNGGEGTTWPGTAMESLGNGIFRIQLPEGHTNVVFNEGSNVNNKTDDIVVQGTGKIWDGGWKDYSNSGNNNNNNNNSDVQVDSSCIYFRDAAGWGTVKCHSWTGDNQTTWPGNDMESLGNGLYKIKLPEGHTNVVFNAGGEHCKTGDLSAEFGKAFNNSTNSWENV